MARYVYSALWVIAYKKRQFPLRYLSDAVEYLKKLRGAEDPGTFIGLQVITKTGCRWPDGKVMFRLDAKPMLKLAEIRGKTKKEVWQAIDAAVDEQRKGLVRRYLGSEPSSWDEYLKPF